MWDIQWRREMPTGVWWGKPDRKRPLDRPKHRGEDTIKLDLKRDWQEGMAWRT